MVDRSADLTGQVFGKLTVIEKIGRNKHYAIEWSCLCECGNTKITNTSSLRSGQTNSCGCADPKNQDLTGKIFGLLTVISKDTSSSSKGGVKWLCECKCGNMAKATTGNLNSGKVRSCGCTKIAPIDMVGKKFGKLEVIEDAGKDSRGSRFWLCKCDCGNTKIANGGSLRAGHTQSCGCSTRQEDYTGRVYWKLTVIGPAERKRRGERIWNCECTCGKTCEVTTYNLSHGLKHSCGCEAGGEDLTGKKIGMLTVVKLSDNKDRGRKLWECVCDCGNTAIASHRGLKSGINMNCGCVTKGEDLTGRVFGKLKVIKRDLSIIKKDNVWVCECICGKIETLSTASINIRRDIGCGCSLRIPYET